jgi:hypothetical protein
MKKYTLEVRSTCIEILVVVANSKEEAIQKAKVGNTIASYVESSDFAEEIDEENIIKEVDYEN